MLHEITSNLLPSIVISWKDKSDSVGGDERMRSEILDAPSHVRKLGNNLRSCFAFSLVKCALIICKIQLKSAATLCFLGVYAA